MFALLGTIGITTLVLCTGRPVLADTVRAEVEISTKEIGEKESPIGNLIADAIRASAKSDLAFLAASYFTSDIKFPKGDVDTNELLKVLEYRDDNIAIVKLTGAQITKALEHGLHLYPKPNSGFLHFSGITVTIDPAGEKEKRVLSVKIEGETLDANKTYKVAMPTPLANGALAYFKIWKKDDIDKEATKKMDNKTLGDAVKAALKERKTIGKGEERLVIKGK